MSNKYIRLLRENPDYTKLWLSRVISLLGDWFNLIVLSALINEYSGNSGIAISLSLLARFLPALILGPYAGVLVDRFNRKRLMIYCDVLRTGLVLMYLFILAAPQYWQLIYPLLVAQFTCSAIFEPAQAALMPSLVRRDDLVLANTIGSITWSTMLAFGAIIGGVVSAVLGAEIALVFDAATFMVSALLITRIVVPPHTEIIADAIQTDDSGGFWDGIRYLRQRPTVLLVTLVKGGSSIGNVDTLLTVFATQVFVLGNGGELSLGILYSTFGVGAFIGPLFLNRFHDGSVDRLRRLILVGFLTATLGWVLMGIASSLVVLALALFIRAIGGSINWTYSSAILQKTVQDQFLGRVFSVDFTLFQLVTVVSILSHGALVDLLGAEYLDTIAYGTCMISLLPLAGWFFALPRMEQYDRQIRQPSLADSEL